MTTSRFLLILLGALSAFAMGCAHDSSSDGSWSPVSPAVMRVAQSSAVAIGPEGGVVTGDGAILTVPPGALQETVLISIELVTENNRAVHVLSPAGLTLAAEDAVTLPKPANAVVGRTYHLDQQSGNGTWQNIGGTDQGGTVSGRVQILSRLSTGDDGLE